MGASRVTVTTSVKAADFHRVLLAVNALGGTRADWLRAVLLDGLIRPQPPGPTRVSGRVRLLTTHLDAGDHARNAAQAAAARMTIFSWFRAQVLAHLDDTPLTIPEPAPPVRRGRRQRPSLSVRSRPPGTTTSIGVSLTAAERAQLTAAAGAAGISRGELIRTILRDAVIDPAGPRPLSGPISGNAPTAKITVALAEQVAAQAAAAQVTRACWAGWQIGAYLDHHRPGHPSAPGD